MIGLLVASQLAGSPIEIPPPDPSQLAVRFECAMGGDIGKFAIRGKAREDRWQKVAIAIESDDAKFPSFTGQVTRMGDMLYLLDERRWAEGERIAYRLLLPDLERNGALIISRRHRGSDADLFVATGLCDVAPAEKLQ